MTPSITLATPSDRPAWDAFVTSSPDATGYHEWAWRDVIDSAFGHGAFYLMARRGSEVEGVLPLVEIRSWLFGRTLTSLPFVNYGGVLSRSDEAAQALLDTAERLARERSCRHVELRHVGRRFKALPCRQHKVAMWLPLGPGIWERFDKRVRNQIRKAEKSGLVAQLGGVELLPDFYAVFARNMRDLGTPVYPRRLFRAVLDAFPGRARLLVVRLEHTPVAAALMYRTGGGVEVPWASSIRDFNPLCPNHLLYWRAIEAAAAEGCERFDFGRSTPGGNTFRFKAQWGAEPVSLHWEYGLVDSPALPDQSPTNPKFRLAIEAWKRCPLWLANTLGPRIVRAIP